MNDKARKKLCDFITNYGSAVCSTPGTCKMVLGQQCSDFPPEKDLLLRALDRGAVAGVMKAPVGGPWDELVKIVAGSSVAPADVRWAIESWAIALGKHPDAAPPPPEPVISMNAPPDASKTGVVRGAASTMAVAIGGAIGGALTCMVLALVLVTRGVTVPPYKPGMSDSVAAIVIVIFGMIGGFLGGSGGALGWFITQMQSSALSSTTEELNRRLRKGIMGALTGAMVGSAAPVFFCGLFGILVGTFFGGLGGAITAGMAGAAGGTSRNY